MPCHRRLPGAARPFPCCSYWGEALVAGMSHKKESAEECCSACRAYQPVKEKDMMTCNGGRLVVLQPAAAPCTSPNGGVHGGCLPGHAIFAFRIGPSSYPAPRQRATLLARVPDQRHSPRCMPARRAAYSRFARVSRLPAVWVYCGDAGLCGDHHKECWLKHLAHPYGTAPAKEGPDVGWTTGIMVPRAETKPSVREGGELNCS